MQIIHYGDDTYTTGDDIAYAVIEYADALAQAGSSDRIRLPFRRDDATTGELQLLIGPASQMVLESVEGPGEEIRDPELVADITRRSRDVSDAGSRPIDIDDQADAVLTFPEDV